MENAYRVVFFQNKSIYTNSISFLECLKAQKQIILLGIRIEKSLN